MTHPSRREREPVYLAYVDDSGTKNGEDKTSPYQVVAGLVIPDKEFIKVEAIAGMVVEDLLKTPEAQEAFTEFHACELYWGTGAFQDLKDKEDLRHAAISQLLLMVAGHNYPIIYGCVDKAALQKTRFSSANPIDVAFRICLDGIEKYMYAQSISSGSEELCILVADDTDDKKTKQDLRRSFRHLRTQQRPPTWTTGELAHFHDDMYFGNSCDSIGIQLADLCAFVIACHRRGIPKTEKFYELFKNNIWFAETCPQDTMLAEAAKSGLF